MVHQSFGCWVTTVQPQSPRDSWNQGGSQAGNNDLSEGRCDVVFAIIGVEQSCT